MVQHYIFDELAEFLATMEPNKVLTFRTSEKSRSRLEKLLLKNKETNLSKDEEKEVEQFMVLEHIVRLAKILAIKRLS